jgi:hypothetical protein
MGGFEIVLILAFILFTVFDGIARSQRRRRGAGQQPRPRPRPFPFELEEEGPEGDTEWPTGVVVAPGSSAGTVERPKGETSEGLVPQDIWEEIAGLMRGEVPVRRPPEKVPTGGTEERAGGTVAVPDRVTPGVPSGQRAPVAVGRRVGRPAGDSGLASPPARPAPEAARLRGTSDRPEEVAAAATPSSPRAGVLLPRGDLTALRRAIVLREVLGPPLALRDPDEDGII